MIDNARIKYSLIDTSLETDTPEITVLSESAHSHADNIMAPGTKKKGTYLERQWFLLDGTYTDLSIGDDVGWESQGLADENGAVIAESLMLSFENTHFSYGISLIFPPRSPFINFKIEYKAGSTVLHTTTVANNADANYTDQTNVNDWDTIIITPTKVQPGQRARLWSIILGIDFLWGGNELIKVTATRATDLTAEKVESSEVVFKFYNDSTFNFKTIKDVPETAQREILIQVDFGIKGQFAKFGMYKSATMSVLERGKIIEITGYDVINQLGQSEFRNGAIPASPRTLKSWADEVAADAGITIATDAILSNITSSGYIPTVPHREAFRLIAEAGNCILFTDTDGFLNIKQHVEQIGGIYTDADLVDGGLDISSTEKTDGVIVHRYTFTAEPNATGLAEIQGIALTGTEQTIWVDYGTFPAKVVVGDIATSSNITLNISKSKVYAECAELTFTGTAGQIGWITVIGKPYGTGTTPFITGTSGNVREIKNPLITSETVATAVLNNIAEKLLGKYQYKAEVYNKTGASEFLKTITMDEDTVSVTKITRTIEPDTASEILQGIS